MNQEQFSYPTKHEHSSKEEFYSKVSKQEKQTAKETEEKALKLEEDLWQS